MEISLNDVKVGDRFRKEFKDMEALQASIRQFGLLVPIIVDEHNHLIAGERRLRAAKAAGLKTISVRPMSDLSELEKREIELEENIQRREFTWQEEVAAKAQLHKLKQELHGKTVHWKQKGKVDREGWGVKQTAESLGESIGGVSMDIQLARGMKAFPQLLKEKSKTVAFKKLKHLQESVLNEELAKRMQKAGMISHPNVHHGDCLDVMKEMPSGSVDLVLTDPPFGINIDKAHTFERMTIVRVYDDEEFDILDLLDKTIAHLHRLLRDDRHIIMFCAVQHFVTVHDLMVKHGFNVHHIPLIWDKGSGSYPGQQTSFVHSYETFIHGCKGKRKFNGDHRDVFPVKRVPSSKKIHPTEKPPELIRDIINLLSQPGETVLDPFAGSGVVVECARDTNRQGIGIEKDATYYEAICKRLGGTDDNS